MADCFNFEIKCRETREVKMLSFQTADGTEWKLTEEWLTSQDKDKRFLQRLIFYKDNNYNNHYFINLEITSVKSHAAGDIKIMITTKPKRTRITIPFEKFTVFKYGLGETEVFHGVAVSKRLLRDDFRYKVTINRAHILTEEDREVRITPQDKILIFSDQIHSLLDTAVFSDVVLTDGFSQVLAHRNILAVRSEYFRAMFQNQLRESKDGRVYLPGIDFEILKKILDFIYSGILKPVDPETVQDLYLAAGFHQVEGLRKHCADFILSHMDVQNVFEILEFSCFHNDPFLQEECKKFAVAHFAEAATLDDWKDFEKKHPKVHEEIVARHQVAEAIARAQNQYAEAVAQNQYAEAVAQNQYAEAVAQNQYAEAAAQNQDAEAGAQNQDAEEAGAQNQDAGAVV